MRKTIIFGTLAVLIIGLELLVAQTAPELRGDQMYRRRGLMNGNLAQTLFHNYCEIGAYPDDPSGCWPTAENHYLDDITLVVSVEVANRDTVLIHPMETQFREFVDESPEGVPWGFEPRPNWFNMDEAENKTPAMSNDDNSWPYDWPDQAADWNSHWNGYFGKNMFNADLETIFVFDDNQDKEVNLEMNYYCDDNDTTRGGLGLWVKARAFQWSQVLAEDCIFWLYDITNESTHDYDETFFAQYIDWGIGGIGGDIQNIGEYTTELDIAYAYGPEGAVGVGGWYPIGYAGYAFLESPGIATDYKDNDGDGIVDETRESDGPGVWLGDYPYGFDEANRKKFNDFYNRDPIAHWTNDENCDWVGYTDVNGNGEWDSDEPLNNDVGEDGVSPYDVHYDGPDDGEGDGMPTNGEPNYNATDPDESDQIGLTGFEIFPTHTYELWHDEENWSVFERAPIPVDQLLQPNNLSMFFSSGKFPLQTGQIERYSMALLFGEDRDDMIKNKKTVQQIYNADYSFAKPPLKPTIQLIPGDGEVTIIWDEIAEKSFDPFLQEYDFEGYLIYRSTEPQFLESKVITDSYGNLTYRKPIAQFDLNDGRTGPHPVDTYGIKYNLGEDTGIRHSYTDTDVKNGQTYYYAVVSYDYGLYTYSSDGVEGISPSECSSIISVNSLGEVTFTDINCGVTTPRPAAAGYIPAALDGDVLHEGPATGYIEVDVVNKNLIPSGLTTYELSFIEDDANNTIQTPYYRIRDVLADTVVVDSSLLTEVGGESPLFNGLAVSLYNDTLIWIDYENSAMLAGSFDYNVKIWLIPDNDDINGYRANIQFPADLLITFHDTTVTYSTAAWGKRSMPSSVVIYNLTDSCDMKYFIDDKNHDKQWDLGDDIIMIVDDVDNVFPTNQYLTTWNMRFEPLFEVGTDTSSGLPTTDTTWLSVDPPSAGDVILLKTTKTFRGAEYEMVVTGNDTEWVMTDPGDVFRFSVQGADSSNTLAKHELDDICVVPNPYVVTASWEPENIYKYGRGERRLHFFHLPKDCTIRIYNLRGHLVDTIEHHSTADDGMEPWDILSSEGNELAYGIYIYHVDAPGVGEIIGRFALIK